MNAVQKVVIIVGMLAVAATVLYPPWLVVVGERSLYMGYAPLWEPPRQGTAVGNTLAVPNLAMQVVGLVLATCALCLVAQRR